MRDAIEEEEMDDYEFGEEITGPDGLRRVLRHDAAFVMRRRAEEGYGLDSVSPVQAFLTAARAQCRGGHALSRR